MRRYLCSLGIVSLVMLLLAFAVKWAGMDFFAGLPVWILPAAVAYFAVVCGLQYRLVVRSMHKDPRAFVNLFLSITVGAHLLHLVVLFGCLLAFRTSAKSFAIGFLVLYVVYTAFIIVSLLRFSRRAGDKPTN